MAVLSLQHTSLASTITVIRFATPCILFLRLGRYKSNTSPSNACFILGKVHLPLKCLFYLGESTPPPQMPVLSWGKYTSPSNACFILGKVHLPLKCLFYLGESTPPPQMPVLSWGKYTSPSNACFILGKVHLPLKCLFYLGESTPPPQMPVLSWGHFFVGQKNVL